MVSGKRRILLKSRKRLFLGWWVTVKTKQSKHFISIIIINIVLLFTYQNIFWSRLKPNKLELTKMARSIVYYFPSSADPTLTNGWVRLVLSTTTTVTSILLVLMDFLFYLRRHYFARKPIRDLFTDTSVRKDPTMVWQNHGLQNSIAFKYYKLFNAPISLSSICI